MSYESVMLDFTMARAIKYSKARFQQIEKKYSATLPAEFHEMWKQGWMSQSDPHYLWMHEMEWFPLEDILEHEFPDDCEPYLPHLVPFAHTGGGDTWCFQSDHGMRILNCNHDSDVGEIYAPNLPTALLLQALEYASGYEESTESQAKMLRRWATDLKLIWPEKWSNLLLEIAQGPPIPYKRHPIPPGDVQTLLSAEEQKQIIRREIDYPELGQDIHWMALDEPD